MVNKVYINPETSLTWTDTAGDYAFDCGGLTADSVRVGARGDLGAAPRAEEYEWRMVVDGFTSATPPVVGERVDCYISTSDGTNEDGDVGTADAAGATVDLPNLTYLGGAVVQTTTAADQLIASGHIRITSRYVSPVWHNNTADTLDDTSETHQFILTPIPSEVQ